MMRTFYTKFELSREHWSVPWIGSLSIRMLRKGVSAGPTMAFSAAGGFILGTTN